MMTKLFIWLMLYTKLDNSSKTSNKEIKERFLKDYPQGKEFNNGQLGGKIGAYLKDLYPDLTKSGNGKDLPVCYNLQLLSEPRADLKRCTLNDLL